MLQVGGDKHQSQIEGSREEIEDLRVRLNTVSRECVALKAEIRQLEKESKVKDQQMKVLL